MDDAGIFKPLVEPLPGFCLTNDFNPGYNVTFDVDIRSTVKAVPRLIIIYVCLDIHSDSHASIALSINN